MKPSTAPRSKRRRWFIAGTVVLACLVAVAVLRTRSDRPELPVLPDQRVRVAQRPYEELSKEELLKLLREAQSAAASLTDYSAVLVKRERIDGELGDEQELLLKIRHEPFSVYLYFLVPEGSKGQEAIYVEGQNDGEMWARGAGLEGLLGTVSLQPDGRIAMRGQKYPITEIGMLNLTERILSGAEEAGKRGKADIRLFERARVDGRGCRCITIARPPAVEGSPVRLMRVFLDGQLGLLLRYEAYDWSGKRDEPPELVEKYTYVDVKPNQGFGDEDFDVGNPDYGFE